MFYNLKNDNSLQKFKNARIKLHKETNKVNAYQLNLDNNV